jgi:hypothetical protein
MPTQCKSDSLSHGLVDDQGINLYRNNEHSNLVSFTGYVLWKEGQLHYSLLLEVNKAGIDVSYNARRTLFIAFSLAGIFRSLGFPIPHVQNVTRTMCVIARVIQHACCAREKRATRDDTFGPLYTMYVLRVNFTLEDLLIRFRFSSWRHAWSGKYSKMNGEDGRTCNFQKLPDLFQWIYESFALLTFLVN